MEKKSSFSYVYVWEQGMTETTKKDYGIVVNLVFIKFLLSSFSEDGDNIHGKSFLIGSKYKESSILFILDQFAQQHHRKCFSQFQARLRFCTCNVVLLKKNFKNMKELWGVVWNLTIATLA